MFFPKFCKICNSSLVLLEYESCAMLHCIADKGHQYVIFIERHCIEEKYSGLDFIISNYRGIYGYGFEIQNNNDKFIIINESYFDFYTISKEKLELFWLMS